MSDDSGWKDRKTNVEIVFLDLFGVVIGFDNNIMYRRLAARCPAPQRAEAQLKGFMASEEIIDGSLDLVGIYRRLFSLVGYEATFDVFTSDWLEPYSWPMPGMVNLVRDLTGRGRIGLISNIDQYYWTTVGNLHPEVLLLDPIVLSFETGLTKPSKDIYLHALSLADTPPERCLFVDDTARNVDAAMELGVRGHLFRSTSGLKRFLAAQGILISEP